MSSQPIEAAYAKWMTAQHQEALCREETERAIGALKFEATPLSDPRAPLATAQVMDDGTLNLMNRVIVSRADATRLAKWLSHFYIGTPQPRKDGDG